MKRSNKKQRLAGAILALAVLLTLVPRGSAAPAGVYFTAANEQLLELTSDTMPFWSRGVLYISSRLFEGTDLNVAYVRNSALGMATLYNTRTDLRFDLKNATVVDKTGVSYNAHAIEKGNVVFFPLDMVCRHFGLSWNMMNSDTAPLIRLTNGQALLSDREFLENADGLMRTRYAAYASWWQDHSDGQQTWPPVQATGEQQVQLIFRHTGREDTLAAAKLLHEGQGTFLFTAEQMTDGDLLRSMVARGHAVVLLVTGETEEEIRGQVALGRELMWRACCSWLGFVWYEGSGSGLAVLDELGCIRVTAALDHRDKPLAGAARLRELLTDIGAYRENVSVILGDERECLELLGAALEELKGAGYRICAWRVPA